ncbi:MAG: ATP-binding protein, partial [Thermotogae bacterium]
MRIDELYIMNPWWRSPEEIHVDRHVRAFEKSTFRYYPEKFFREIPKEKPGIYTIRGPRQIGKTTFLKLYIKKLIEDGVKPSNILFFTCDGISDRFDLIETVRTYFQMFEGKPEEIRYIFIDEITTIENWQKSLKYLVDIGILDNCLVVLTGSSAYDLKRSSERLPGRKGHGKDLVYIPITFREFLRSLRVEVETKTIEEILTSTVDDLNRLYLKNA